MILKTEMSVKELRELEIMSIIKKIEKHNKYIQDTFYIRLSKQLRKVHSQITILIIRMIRNRTYICDPTDIYDLMIDINKIDRSIKCENPISREFDSLIKQDINKIFNLLKNCNLMKAYDDLI